MLKRIRTDILTSAGGDFTKEIQVGPSILLKVFYIRGALDGGADITITDNLTGETVFSLTDAGTSNITAYPKRLNQLNTDGSNLTTHDFVIVSGPLTLTVAQGGNALSGSIDLFLL